MVIFYYFNALLYISITTLLRYINCRSCLILVSPLKPELTVHHIFIYFAFYYFICIPKLSFIITLFYPLSSFLYSLLLFNCLFLQSYFFIFFPLHVYFFITFSFFFFPLSSFLSILSFISFSFSLFNINFNISSHIFSFSFK